MVFVMRVLLSQIIKCIKLATLALASKVVFVLLISFHNLLFVTTTINNNKVTIPRSHDGMVQCSTHLLFSSSSTVPLGH